MIPDYLVTQSKGQVVHRPGRGYAYLPVMKSAGIVLNRSLGSGSEYLDGSGRERKIFQAPGVDRFRPRPVLTHPFTQVFEVRLNPVNFGLVKCFFQFLYRFISILSMGKNLGE